MGTAIKQTNALQFVASRVGHIWRSSAQKQTDIKLLEKSSAAAHRRGLTGTINGCSRTACISFASAYLERGLEDLQGRVNLRQRSCTGTGGGCALDEHGQTSRCMMPTTVGLKYSPAPLCLHHCFLLNIMHQQMLWCPASKSGEGRGGRGNH